MPRLKIAKPKAPAYKPPRLRECHAILCEQPDVEPEQEGLYMIGIATFKGNGVRVELAEYRNQAWLYSTGGFMSPKTNIVSWAGPLPDLRKDPTDDNAAIH